MKIKGVQRSLDTLGRVVTPKEYRDSHGLNNGDKVEIFNTDKGILICPAGTELDTEDL